MKGSEGLGVVGPRVGTRLLVLLSYRTGADEIGGTVTWSPLLPFRLASDRVELLATFSGSRLRPSLSRLFLLTDCQANDAALLVTVFEAFLDSEVLVLGFFLVLSGPRNVCSIVLPFSGLGLLEVLFTGGASEGADEEATVFGGDEACDE